MSRDQFTQEEFEEFVSQVRHLKEQGAIKRPLPSVTISRDAGSRGVLTAHALKQFLDATESVGLPWKVFESNLVNILLKRDKLPDSLAVRMSEDKIGFLKRIQGVFSKEPSNMLLFKKTTAFLQELLELGQCVIVGRGAGLLAQEMPQVFKVKLLVSEETAIRRIAKDEKVSRSQAVALRIKRNDERAAYIRNYHHWGLSSREKFDLVIQTDELRVVEVAEKIGRALRSRGQGSN